VKYTNTGKIEFFINYLNSTNSNFKELNSSQNSLEKIDVDNEYALNNKSDEFLEIKIKDTGIGISEDRKLYFLDPLGINSVSEKKSKEQGFGLFIVQEILRQFDTKLEINSKYGVGTTFSFRLPIKNLNSGTKLILNKSKSLLDLSEVSENIGEEDVEDSRSINFKNKLPYVEFDKKSEDSIETKNLGLEEIKLDSKYRSILNSGRSEDSILNPSTHPINVNNNYNVVFNVEPVYQNFATKPDTQGNDQLSYISSIDTNTKFLIIVDDEKFTRKSTIRIIKKTLQKYYFSEDENLSQSNIIQILESEDGVECLYTIYKLLKSGSKNITVISDENMMHMNGSICAETLKKLKNLNTEKIPFILLTAYMEISSQYIDYFISKPLSENHAEKILSEYMGMRKIK
jgi:CheY-like chemotaxis protein